MFRVWRVCSDFPACFLSLEVYRSWMLGRVAPIIFSADLIVPVWWWTQPDREWWTCREQTGWLLYKTGSTVPESAGPDSNNTNLTSAAIVSLHRMCGLSYMRLNVWIISWLFLSSDTWIDFDFFPWHPEVRGHREEVSWHPGIGAGISAGETAAFLSTSSRLLTRAEASGHNDRLPRQMSHWGSVFAASLRLIYSWLNQTSSQRADRDTNQEPEICASVICSLSVSLSVTLQPCAAIWIPDA